MTNDEKTSEYKSSLKSKDITNDWNNLVKFSGSKIKALLLILTYYILLGNHNFKPKDLYKERYDYSDVDEHALEFKSSRNSNTHTLTFNIFNLS